MSIPSHVETALPPKAIRQVWEPILTRVLASPFHAMMSRTLMLILVTGCKSGKLYTLPVPYMQADGGTLVIMAAGVWWKNLRGGAPVQVRLRGTNYRGIGEVHEAPDVVRLEMQRFLRRRPDVARLLRIRIDRPGKLVADGLDRASKLRVIVYVRLSEPAPLIGTPS